MTEFGNKRQMDKENLPEVLSVLPLSPGLLLPQTRLLVHVEDPKYVALIDAVMQSHRMLAIVQTNMSDGENNTDADEMAPLCKVGCLGRIVQYGEAGDHGTIIVVLGVCRFKILEEIEVDTPWRQVRVTTEPYSADFLPSSGLDKIDRAQVLNTLKTYMMSKDLQDEFEEVEYTPTDWLVNSLCMLLPYGVGEKQAFLEASDLSERADLLIAVTEYFLAREGKITTLVSLQ